MPLVKIHNHPMLTTTGPTAVATGAALRTMLQSLRSEIVRVVDWSISFDASAAGVPGIVELLSTGTIAATMATAHTITGVQKFAPASMPDATGFTLSTTGTAFGVPSGEGTITATRSYETHHIAPTNGAIIQLPLSREPEIAASDVLRIRVEFPVTVNCLCSFTLEI